MRTLYLEPGRCLGCHSCELACAAAHSAAGDLLGAVRGGETPARRLYVEPAGRGRATVVFCRHCLRPPCLAACPTGAIWRRDDGAVLVDEERCIGCRACEEACPFGVIAVVGEVAVKCDLCGGEPACVAACPTGALRCDDPRALARRRRRARAGSRAGRNSDTREV